MKDQPFKSFMWLCSTLSRMGCRVVYNGRYLRRETSAKSIEYQYYLPKDILSSGGPRGDWQRLLLHVNTIMSEATGLRPVYHAHSGPAFCLALHYTQFKSFFHLQISAGVITMHVFSQCINYRRLHRLHWRKKKKKLHYHFFPLFLFASFPFVYVYTMHVITPRRSRTRRLTGFHTEKYQITANKYQRHGALEKFMSLEAVHV